MDSVHFTSKPKIGCSAWKACTLALWWQFNTLHSTWFYCWSFTTAIIGIFADHLRSLETAEKSQQDAEAFKNRLVEYDRNARQRTTVVDDQNDYFEIDTNAWLDPEVNCCFVRQTLSAHHCRGQIALSLFVHSQSQAVWCPLYISDLVLCIELSPIMLYPWNKTPQYRSATVGISKQESIVLKSTTAADQIGAALW